MSGFIGATGVPFSEEKTMTDTISASVPKKKSGGIGSMLRNAWQVLSAWPLGDRLFSAMVGVKAPYTGTIGARVLELQPGYAKVQMRDRWIVRNFVPSIHAIAMTNLGEMTSGLALLCGLPAGMRGIVKKLSTEYFAIAHGTLVAVSHSPKIEYSTEKRTYEVRADVYQLCDPAAQGALPIPGAGQDSVCHGYGILVATFSAEWHISPVTK